MSNSIKTLVGKTKYGSKTAEKELALRQKSFLDTGLWGFGGERIVFNLTEDIENYLSYICGNIGKVMKSDVKEVILIDSYSSATIEGARTSIENVRKAFGAKKKSKSDQMVINTVAGTSFAIENGVSEDNIRALWEIIVKDVCENVSVMGEKYRSGEVVIASEDRVIHTPCDYRQIPAYMDTLFAYDYSDILLSECIKHFYFVYVHPFCDGNGRLARVWTYSNLIRKFNKQFQYISISDEIMNNVHHYYNSLAESEFVYEGKLDITTFIEFFLNCICSAISKGITSDILLDDVDRNILKMINKDGITVVKLL